MTIYIDDPYRREMPLTIPPVVMSKGYHHFLLEDSILTPPIKNYTKGDRATFNHKEITPEIDEAGVVRYKGKDIAEEEEGRLLLDWNQRLQMMQDNIARIILRIAFREIEGVTPLQENTEEENYFIFPIQDLGRQTTEKIEDFANRIVQSNFPIDYTEDKKAVKVATYFKEKSYGPKLSATGECAIILLGDIKKEGENLKVTFHTGADAINRYRKQRELISNLGLYYGKDNPEEVWKAVKKQRSQNDDLEKRNQELEELLGLEQINEYLEKRKVREGVSYIYEIVDDVNFKQFKKLVDTIQSRSKFVQIYGIPNGREAQIIAARSQDVNVDLKKIMDRISISHNLNGTGNMFRVQGNCPTAQLALILENFLVAIQTELQEK